MPFYAFSDEEKTTIVYAENVTLENQQAVYYCPTPDCSAHFFIRGLNNGERAPHFVVYPEHDHSLLCDIRRVSSVDPTKYKENMFSLDSFEQNLLNARPDGAANGGNNHGNGDGLERPISTVRQLYAICIMRHINQTYNNIRISSILADRRTNHIYTTYVEGFKLVDCTGYKYDNENLTYYAKYQTHVDDVYLDLKLKFHNRKLFREHYNIIMKNRIIVAGRWRAIPIRQRFFSVDIYNKKQIFLLTD